MEIHTYMKIYVECTYIRYIKLLVLSLDLHWSLIKKKIHNIVNKIIIPEHKLYS